MIYLIAGASHVGKTVYAQKLLETYQYPYLSIDHLKMGLIRSGQTDLTPLDDDKLTDYLWPIVREMMKTAIENKQNLIIEGCYIPFDWQKDFDREYLENIRYMCLVMSRKYIENHFADILAAASSNANTNVSMMGETFKYCAPIAGAYGREEAQVHFQLFGFYHEIYGGQFNEPSNTDCGVLCARSG